MLTDTVSSDGCTRVAPRQNPGAAASNPFYLGVKLLKYAQKLITASLTQSGMGMGIYVMILIMSWVIQPFLDAI